MLQLQLQLRYTTLHPAVVGEVTDQVTTATIAATCGFRWICANCCELKSNAACLFETVMLQLFE
jgi:hypothetical protein